MPDDKLYCNTFNAVHITITYHIGLAVFFQMKTSGFNSVTMWSIQVKICAAKIQWNQPCWICGAIKSWMTKMTSRQWEGRVLSPMRGEREGERGGLTTPGFSSKCPEEEKYIYFLWFSDQPCQYVVSYVVSTFTSPFLSVLFQHTSDFEGCTKRQIFHSRG